jgi:hypothetical protein
MQSEDLKNSAAATSLAAPSLEGLVSPAITRFQSPRVFRMSSDSRLTVTVGSAMLALMLLKGVYDLTVGRSESGIRLTLLETFLSLAIVVAFCYAATYAIRSGFSLGREGVTTWGAFGSRVLPWVEIDGYEAELNNKAGVYVLTLLPSGWGKPARIHFTREELLDPQIADWITSMPNKGSLELPLSERARESPGSDLLMRMLQGLLCGGMVLAMTVITLPDLRKAIQGPLPLEQLELTAGMLQQLEPCRHTRGQGYFEVAHVINESGGVSSVTLPCLIPSSASAASQTRHVEIYRDTRPFADDELYQLILDGTPLQRYSEHVKQIRRNAKIDFAMELAMLLLMSVLVVSIFRGDGRRA